MVTGDRGTQIVDLNRARVGRLARSLAGVLESGHVTADVSTVGDVEEWRRAARRVAADRGWRVRTGLTGDGSRVWAVRLDREPTEEDRAVLRDRLGYLGALLGRQ